MCAVPAGVGQHQMWSAQWYDYDYPRHWVTSGGLGSMGFGLPSALGAQAAFDGYDGRGVKTVVNFDGDGSFMMNPQELATVMVHKLPVKTVVLNNQHLGMVVQWEDRFYKHNRAHTYLGKADAEWHVTYNEDDIYPNLPMMAASCGVKARRVIKKEELREAVRCAAPQTAHPPPLHALSAVFHSRAQTCGSLGLCFGCIALHYRCAAALFYNERCSAVSTLE